MVPSAAVASRSSLRMVCEAVASFVRSAEIWLSAVAVVAIAEGRPASRCGRVNNRTRLLVERGGQALLP